MIFRIVPETPGLNSKWANKVKDILDRCGRSDIWDAQQCNSNLTYMIKSNVIEQYKQDWYADLDKSSKGRIYILKE